MNSRNSYNPHMGTKIYPQNQNNLMRTNNFYNVFKPNKNMVTMRNFRNQNDLLFNNLEEDVLHQDIHEITIQIDTADRDYKIYPNPFNFKVTFNPTPDSFDRNTKIKFKGTPKPTIPINFSNVKYIKLDHIILPQNCYLIKKFNKKNDNINLFEKISWEYNKNKNLKNERFILLDIKELFDNSIFGTNSAINKSFCTIYTDKSINNDFFTATTLDCIKIFPTSQLGDIKTWTISFMDCKGNQLEMCDIDTKIDTPKYCICKFSKYTNKQKKKCVCKYIRHPLNPKFQIFMSFKIGVLRNELNINPLKN